MAHFIKEESVKDYNATLEKAARNPEKFWEGLFLVDTGTIEYSCSKKPS